MREHGRLGARFLAERRSATILLTKPSLNPQVVLRLSCEIAQPFEVPRIASFFSPNTGIDEAEFL